MKKGDRYGLHRVIEPAGALPQPAQKVDNTMEIYDNEILIDVQTLNIDSASFTQLKKAAGGDKEKIEAMILEIVNERGKMQNPVTGSGGMLIGTIAQVGPASSHHDLKPGDKIATLVSLSLTPLKINKIREIRENIDQVDVDAQAILFDSGIYAKLPDDMEETLALAILDVAGAPAQTARLVKPGDTVVIIGAGGKSGLLCLAEAKKHAGPTGKVIALVHSQKGLSRIKEVGGLADVVYQAEATKPAEVLKLVEEATDGQLADVVINNVNVPDTEMATILAAKDDGIIYFFSMATSFTKAALGAEGIGKDATMLIGNGYARGHAELSLQVIRDNPRLRELFTRLYT